MNLNTTELLLVEDNIDDAELTIRELKKHHICNNIYHVQDGEQALEFLFGTGKYAKTRKLGYPPKLVLLDIQMPKLNGMEVLEQIKTDERTKRIPVVILTSSKEDPDIQKCYNLGANSYIVKPVAFDNFADAIKKSRFFLVIIKSTPILILTLWRNYSKY